MSKRYFGTDGIRGRVGQPPVTPDFMLRLGHAVGSEMQTASRRLVVIGKDTRLSGYMFESALEAGLAAAGADIALLGPLPTPAVSYLTRTLGGCAGIVISASHNPYHDNGIKLFAHNGGKLPNHDQQAIEQRLEQLLQAEYLPMSAVNRIGKARRIDDAAGRYIEFCKASIDVDISLENYRIVIDCAHGAGYQVAPRILEELGAEVIAINNQPDGLNINRECGSTHPQGLQQAVQTHNADLGLALDGDADRVIMVDHQGRLVDGDGILYILASERFREGRLSPEQGVVGTLMTNYGLEQALARNGIPMERSDVGDRFVHQKLLEHSWQLGGETSGHVLCLDKSITGDGMLTAVQVLQALARRRISMAQAVDGLQLLPQIMINVPLGNSCWADLQQHVKLTDAVSAVERQLDGVGRLVLRPSGTEPLVRIMVEHEDNQLAAGYARQVAAAVQELTQNA